MKILPGNGKIEHCIVFVSETSYFYPMSLFVWGQLRHLAGLYGYTPPAAIVPMLSETEVLKFADALYDGLDDIPEKNALKRKREVVRDMETGAEKMGLPFGTDVNPFEWFGHDNGIDWLTGFIFKLYRYRRFDVRPYQEGCQL